MTNKPSKILPNFHAYALKNFHVQTYQLESQVLAGNPLGDSPTRFHGLLLPRQPGSWPVVFVLAGFSGNAPFSFNPRFNEANAVQVIDEAVSRGQAPEALYCFVDALTSWGGSQFINSPATGRYEDMIVQELVPDIKKQFPVSKNPGDWCLTGGSSGGYGALHLGSKFPEIWGRVAAIAPDCFFEASLLPDLYLCLPFWAKCGSSAAKALQELRTGKLAKQKNWHHLLNALGMAACYGATGDGLNFEFPLNVHSGLREKEIWNKWLQHDPLEFLPKRAENLRQLEGLYIDVGNKDNFHLQYGARQISTKLQDLSVRHEYTEFDGNHFDIGERRVEVWKWLAGSWRV